MTGQTSRVAARTLFVVAAGSLLHFAWEWSGHNPVVGVFAAVSESTWEHPKLAFWPALALASLQRRLYGRPPGWLPATAVRALLPPVAIVVLFYGYTAVLGAHHLALDIGVFALAVLAGEAAGHALMRRRPSSRARLGAAAALVAFATLTFDPPALFLFEAPAEGAHR